MQFNPDPGKQANSYFLSKTKTTFLFPLLKSIPLTLLRMSSSKTSRNWLDSKLNFNTHVDQQNQRVQWTSRTYKRLEVNVPRNTLLSIYNSLIRHLFDYLYDKTKQWKFQNKFGKVLYQACLATTAAIPATPRETFTIS